MSILASSEPGVLALFCGVTFQKRLIPRFQQTKKRKEIPRKPRDAALTESLQLAYRMPLLELKGVDPETWSP